ncbi:hypothetical protein E2A64_08850 [Pseudohoeflea suaedae]|uniref:SnoaL-like domain-containing protein n=1 Tax=Pseudohoeflea suaedae TaxID=877384 RepID=A0A4R5PRD5_9HYPH|nr:nuclear transport factor 2 family protein [Pseudohoeflea suaedae]TDH39167.1 hypothetical protein E2A64_08850 [Pseudohoeflea suaedae]
MSTIDVDVRNTIHDLLCRFFLAFDEKDWVAMRATLADEVFIDYASSGREQPGAMTGDEFVGRRRGAVDELSKQHSFSNLLLSATDSGVHGRCNYLILRFATASNGAADSYHSCGSYEFVFQPVDASWRISSITQKALRSWGNRDLHGGSRN